MKSLTRLALATLMALSLAGCASLVGNASYEVECPVIGADGFAVTTSTGLPVTKRFKVDSGRVLAGGVQLEVEDCFKFDAPKVEQGEDRSPGIFGAVMRLLGI